MPAQQTVAIPPQDAFTTQLLATTTIAAHWMRATLLRDACSPRSIATT